MSRTIKKYTKEEKEKYIKEYKKSRLSISNYLKQVEIPEATFRGWLKKEEDLKFGELELENEAKDVAVVPEEATILITDTIKIELKRGYDKKLLKKFVEVLIND